MSVPVPPITNRVALAAIPVIPPDNPDIVLDVNGTLPTLDDVQTLLELLFINTQIEPIIAIS